MTNNMQPIFILPEETKRNTGRDAQRNNIAAAKAVAESVRTTLGPKGMDKMIVDSMGDTIITNDGVTILKEMNIEHPAAKMIVEVAKNQEMAVGDGTTSSVILAGQLLKEAENLLDLEIHPTMIAKGYHLAGQEAQKLLHQISKPITINDSHLLQQIAVTAMTGKGAEANKELLATLVVEAVKSIAEPQNNTYTIDLDNIKIETVVGESVNESKLIRGIVIDKERVHPEMPLQLENPEILLLNSSLEIKNTEIDAKIQITSPSQLDQFLAQEERMLKEMIDTVVASGAKVVFCQKGIDELAQHYLAKAGVMAFRRVRKSDMEKLARATNATIMNSYKDVTTNNLGKAAIVHQKKLNDDNMVYVEGCPNPKAMSIIVRGGTEHVTEEIKRSLDDALGDLSATLREGKIVAGAGATEILVAKHLQKFSEQLQGREQLAVQAFSKALEIIPRTLAENAGIDPIDVLTALKASPFEWPGINVFTGKIMNSWDSGVIEPLKIKTQAIKSATEVAEMLLRIDDVIVNAQNSPGPQMPNRMPNM